MLRLLCVTAHPDDEAGGFGGALLHYHRKGVETSVICLTEGTAATHRGGAANSEDLAAMRRREFAASCRMLGVTHGEVLSYRDGALERENLVEVTGELVQRIRRFRPQVVLTFGLEGALTAHPDHSMAAVFATLAYHWAGRTNRYPEQLGSLAPHRASKLYYTSALFTLPDRQPASLPPVTAVLDIADCVEIKVAAFTQHHSQAPLFPLFENTMRQRGALEMYHLAASVTPGKAEEEHDLFTGIEDEEAR
jgi:LmbE family N-acetylglucosaminyl deacetylase